MAKNLVTGGGGYIGVVLCEDLLSRGEEVVALDRFFFGLDKISHLQRRPGFSYVKHDTRFVPDDVLNGVDTVFDLAGFSNDATAEIDPNLTESVNLAGCLRFAAMAKKRGVKRYVYSSSASVYGAGDSPGLTEESPVHPLTWYAKCKLEAENGLLAMNSPDFQVVIARNATLFGVAPRMRFDLAVNVMTMRAWKERLIYIMGGGGQWRPFIHLKDLTRAFRLMRDAPAEEVAGEVFNVGGNSLNYRIKELACLVLDVVPNVQLHVVPDDLDQRNYNLCFDKIRRVLGFEPEVSIQEGIAEVRQALENGRIQADAPDGNTWRWYKSYMEWEKRIGEALCDGRLF